MGKNKTKYKIRIDVYVPWVERRVRGCDDDAEVEQDGEEEYDAVVVEGDGVAVERRGLETELEEKGSNNGGCSEGEAAERWWCWAPLLLPCPLQLQRATLSWSRTDDSRGGVGGSSGTRSGS